jgi:uncharacterized protein YjgD (DUF1641 family)
MWFKCGVKAKKGSLVFLMDTKEYERRRGFLDAFKKLHNSEYIDIVKILRQEAVDFSENSNGIFFDVTTLSQTTFNVLEKYIDFVHNNRKELAERERLMSTMNVVK